jgi:hypothetical protein
MNIYINKTALHKWRLSSYLHILQSGFDKKPLVQLTKLLQIIRDTDRSMTLRQAKK